MQATDYHTAIEMDLSEEDELIRSTVRDFLEREDAQLRAREWWANDADYDRELWTKFAGLGLSNMAASEAFAGIEASPLTVAVVSEEIGRSAAALPFEMHSTALRLLSQAQIAGSWDAAGISTGVLSVDLHARADRDPHAAGAGTLLSMVPEGAICDAMLVPTGDALYVGRGFEREHVATMGMNRFANITLASSELREAGSLSGEAIGSARTFATVLFAAKIVGLGQWMLSETTEHAARRVQFGRPLGSFQAIQHKVAEMHIAVTASRFLSRHAAMCIAQGTGDVEAARAKAFAGSMIWRVGTEAHQVHGGVGFILDHPLHLYFSQARGADALFGSVREHHVAVGRSLLRGGRFTPNTMLGVA